jgi:hypothetical protein
MRQGTYLKPAGDTPGTNLRHRRTLVLGGTMKSLVVCMVTLSALVACAGDVSLGRGADGLKAGDACSADRCSGQAVDQRGCASGQPVITCTSDGAGKCNSKVTCPGTPPTGECTAEECSMIPRQEDARVCLTGTYGRDVCVRNAGKCGWDFSPCPAVVPADAQVLSAINAGGGFVPAPPAGSACGLGEESYILTLATKTLAFYTCNAPAGGVPYAKQSGSTVLADADVANVKAAFNALAQPNPADACAADFQELRVEIQNPAKTQVYFDSRSVCGNGGTKPATVKDTDSVFAAMRAVAK